MSGFDEPETGKELNESLIIELGEIAKVNELEIVSLTNIGKMLKKVLQAL